MIAEYWLQKKTIGGWSNVTWYDDIEQAKRNYNECSKGLSGYSWRLCKVEAIECKMLEDVVEVKAPELQRTGHVPALIQYQKEALKAKPVQNWMSGWGEPVQDAPKSSGWASTASGWGNSTSNDPSLAGDGSVSAEHGLSGSVWVINHATRHKSRVPGSELDSYLAKGYIKAGPRTAFNEKENI